MRRESMPIMNNPLMNRIPFAMIAPHEAQAEANHWQSLERLAERGGLSACEAIAILEDRKWRHMGSKEEDARMLINKIREWRALTQGASQLAAPLPDSGSVDGGKS